MENSGWVYCNWNFVPITPGPQVGILKGPPIKQVICELEITKQFANKRPKYIKGLIAYLNMFARGRENSSISDFDAPLIEKWFAARQEALTTRASNLGRLSSLFSYAVRHEYIQHNPCDRIERVTIDRAEPPVLSIDQVCLALQFALNWSPRFLLWFVLSGIIGLRPEELTKLDGARLRRHLTEGLLILDSMVSKVRNRRLIELSSHARAWLDYALSDPVKLPFSKSFIRRSRRYLKRHLSLKRWPQDILRHTALSHMLALHGDENRVARESGNSVKIFQQHYKGIVLPAESQRFQQMLPPQSDRTQLELFHPLAPTRAI